MLVLSRTPGQAIDIGPVRITYVKVERSRVTLDILRPGRRVKRVRVGRGAKVTIGPIATTWTPRSLTSEAVRVTIDAPRDWTILRSELTRDAGSAHAFDVRELEATA